MEGLRKEGDGRISFGFGVSDFSSLLAIGDLWHACFYRRSVSRRVSRFCWGFYRS